MNSPGWGVSFDQANAAFLSIAAGCLKMGEPVVRPVWGHNPLRRLFRTPLYYQIEFRLESVGGSNWTPPGRATK
jgi:hypothetical protein